MSNIYLDEGCCLDLLPDIRSKSIDMICADMPYGTTNCKWDSVIDLKRLWPELERVIKDNGAIVLFSQTPFDKVLGASNLDMLRYEFVWQKNVKTGFLNAKLMPLKEHENILIFYKKLPTYNPQMTYGHKRKTSSRISTGSECYGKLKKTSRYDSTERYPKSILNFGNDKGVKKIHPTQKPLLLIEYLIKTYSNEGETVLDFCFGSGVAGIACKNLDRNFIGFEKNIKHFKDGKNRIEYSDF